MAQINLSVVDRRNLAKWMGFRNIKLSLIYSAARDGWTRDAFHAKCDDRSPLLVVSATESGYVFGGYATKPWVSKYFIDSAPGSFLFRLKKENRADYMKFAGTDKAAVMSLSNYGPSFCNTSGNHALSFFHTDDVTTHPGQKFVTCSDMYINISNGFQNNGENNKKALTGGDKRLLNVEIYTVEESIELSVDDRKHLARWMGLQNCRLSLIYSVAQDGWTGEAFHKHCNNRSPLLVVSATESGYVFGGYATEPWVRGEQKLPAPGSFLFRLRKDNKVDYMKFAGKDTAAVMSISSCGPWFGDTSGNVALRFFYTGDVTKYPTQQFVTSSQLSSDISHGFENNGEDDHKALTGGDKRLINFEVYTVDESIELSVDDRKHLAEWMGQQNCRLSLIYSAARDGWTGEAFHAQCDDRSPLLVVGATESGYVFGGYATKPWVSKDHTTLSAPGSFLFRLKKENRADYMKFAGRDTEAHVLSCSNYGPWFGFTSEIYALRFFTTGHVKKHAGQKFVTCDGLDSDIKYGFENNGEDDQKALTGGDKRLLNVEVYTVEDSEEEAKPLEDIRTLRDNERTKLSDEIRTERRKEERKERSRKEEEEIRDKEDGCARSCCKLLQLLLGCCCGLLACISNPQCICKCDNKLVICCHTQHGASISPE